MVGRKRSVNLLQWGSLLREGSNTGRKGCWGGAISMGEPCRWGSNRGRRNIFESGKRMC